MKTNKVLKLINDTLIELAREMKEFIGIVWCSFSFLMVLLSFAIPEMLEANPLFVALYLLVVILLGLNQRKIYYWLEDDYEGVADE